jgi:hypothetical protein
MRRYFESLRPADASAIHSVPNGIFLVRVDRVQYRWHKQKPYYEIHTRERCRRPRVVCTGGKCRAFDPDRFVSKINHHAIDGTRQILLSSLRMARPDSEGLSLVWPLSARS